MREYDTVMRYWLVNEAGNHYVKTVGAEFIMAVILRNGIFETCVVMK
jgi:hypothetical protein